MIRSYSYKMRLFPNKLQSELLDKHFGCVRFIFNLFLSNKIESYNTTKGNKPHTGSFYADSKELTTLKQQPETVWLNEVNSQALQQSLHDLHNGFKNFYEKRAGFPKFKKKNRKNSFRIPQFVKVEERRIYFPKFKTGIKIDCHRPIQGEITSATVSKTSSGKYYAAIHVRRNLEHARRSSNKVGIDLGIKTLVTTSDGIKLRNPKTLNKYTQRLRLLTKAVARCEDKQSKGCQKAKIRLSKLHEKIANIRNDCLHKISRKLVDDNQVIVLETLNVKGMMKNHRLAKSLADCSFSELVRQIEYKSDWAGRQVIKISRWFPSSKRCNVCGKENKHLTLKDRSWKCLECKTVHDRDINAAKNILAEGLNNWIHKPPGRRG